MGKSHYTSASAGTGKTYTLTHELAKVLASDKNARAIVTSFSKAAAAELKTKTRKVLVETRQLEDIDRVDQFLIGTVHGVAESFIRKYWQFLEVSPGMNIIADEELKSYMISLLNAEDTNEPYVYQKMSDLFKCDWREQVWLIVEKSITYGISISELEEDMADCLKEAERIFRNTALPDDEFETSYRQIIDGLPMNPATNAYETRMNLKTQLDSLSMDLNWFINYNSLCNEVKKLKYVVDGKLVLDWRRSMAVSDLICRYVELAGKRAVALMGMIQDRKKNDMILTYTDMETYFLRLLTTSEAARSEIASTYTHLFVDEFQDSSALQVQIFSELAKIIGEENCYYYGDTKQVIYSWRSADPELTNAMSSSMDKGNPLSMCRRSKDKIALFSKDLLSGVFSDLVSLTAKDSGGELEIWDASASSVDNSCTYIADNILTEINARKIIDKKSKPSDIAVLSRDNNYLKKLSTVLEARGIPFCFKGNPKESEHEEKIEVSRERILVAALLDLAKNPDDKLNSALAVELTMSGFNINKVIETILSDKGDITKDCGIVAVARNFNSVAEDMSVSELVEALICKCGLFNDCNNRHRNGTRKNELLGIISQAKEYEQKCAAALVPSTVDGFRELLVDPKKRSSGDPDGVVLSTIHVAKGLEWPVVIVLPQDENGYDENAIRERNVYGKVNVWKESAVTADNPFPKAHVFFLPQYKAPSEAVDSLVRATGISSKCCKNVTRTVIDENRRLLYVAITRAKDKLVLVDSKGMNFYRESAKLSDNDVLDFTAMGFTRVEKPADEEKSFARSYHEAVYQKHEVAEDSQEKDKRDFSPSQLDEGRISAFNGTIIEPFVFCEGEKVRMAYGTSVEDNIFGDCIHHLFGIPEIWKGNPDKVSEIASQYGVVFNDTSVVEVAWQKLIDYLGNESLFGRKESEFHELPFKFMDAGGHIYTGSMDLVWKTDKGCVIVDYKTFQGKASDIIDHSREKHYASQLACYKSALEAAGEIVIGTFLYYPVLQALVETN